MKKTPYKKTPRLNIPNFTNNFCPFLHERAYNVVDHFLELDGQFTLITNIRDRTSQATLDSKVLIYAGVEKQLELLEKKFNKQPNKAAKESVDALKKYSFPAESGIASKSLYEEFRDGELDMGDVKEDSLSSYFDTYLEGKNFKNEGQKYEYDLLELYFNIQEDKYISIPLIQFGHFDGVVHIVYKKDLSDKIESINQKKLLTRLLCFEYEAILLDYDSFGENIHKKSLLKEELALLATDEYYERFNTNKILKELNLKEYYQSNLSYFKERLEHTDAIPNEFLKQHRKNAIMSILIDSYAHNMSAHSLTALEWLFRLRAERLLEKEVSDEVIEETLQDNYLHSPLITSEKPFASEIHPLLRFLLNKGAFWTGITRKGRFGGKISSLYSVLWHDFIRNPLYLGTIAYSEGILKLNINLSIYEKIDKGPYGIKWTKKIKRSSDGSLLNGQFVQIDLRNFYDVNQDIPPAKEHSGFIKKSNLFSQFKEELKNCRVFFPGGVVGRHAFFTILENEIRNVKHYSEEQIKQMKEEGLTLNLSIEDATYQEDILPSNDSELYKIGVWLNHSVNLDYNLLTSKLERLKTDIVDEHYAPKLGGTYQDKVCAAMLINNEFISVQRIELLRDQKFYPWVKTGSSIIIDKNILVEEIEDTELSLRRYDPSYFRREILKNQTDFMSNEQLGKLVTGSSYLQSNYHKHKGYLKKFFHLWKGENIHEYKEEKTAYNKEWENFSRFRFISIDDSDRQNEDIQTSGVTRLIQPTVSTIEKAYRTWLKSWLHTRNGYQIEFNVKGQNAARLIYDGEKIKYYNQAAINQLSRAELRRFNQFSGQQEIDLVHSTSEIVEKSEAICKYRSHGIFIAQYCKGQKPHQATILEKDGIAGELLEVFATNICIFDNRIANRVQRANTQMLKNALNCTIHPEEIDLWKKEQQSGFSKYHFLVVHLSFIEAFRDENGQKIYSEKDIDQFIQKEIIQEQDIKDNFKLVITTGRGRTQWWTKLKNNNEQNYTSFTTFRPVESLIASVENSVSMGDDIELKYRLVKVLFGS